MCVRRDEVHGEEILKNNVWWSGTTWRDGIKRDCVDVVVLRQSLIPTMSIDDIKADLKALVAEKNCGPLMIRLSWHDAGKWSSGKLTGGKCYFL